LKINYLGIIAGITAFISLFLPWFTIELWTENLSSTMSFTANLYQLTGAVEGVTKSMFLITWFNAGTFVLILASGFMCIAASLFIKTRKTILLFVASVLALAAMAVFGFGLANSNFAVESLNPSYTINQFPEGSFGLSSEQSMQMSYDYSWAIGIGFWLASITSILALSATFLSKKRVLTT
jgi:hypothetical protein